MNRNFQALYFLTLLILIALLTYSCKTEDPTEPNSEEDNPIWQPLEPNLEWHYRIDTVFFEFPDNNSSWWLSSKIISRESDSSYLVQRSYFSDSLMSSAKSIETWKYVRLNNKLLVYENSIPRIRLNDPLFVGKSWLLNAYNANNSVQTRVYCTDISTCLATIEEYDLETALSKKAFYQKYSADIGLSEQYKIDASFEGSELPDPNLPWEEKANKGYVVKWELLEFIN